MKYTKMHGLGNDFIVFYEEDGHDKDYKNLAIELCDRHTGIGADGLIIGCPSKTADICMRIINSDGSEAEMCGNGIRCFADYMYKHGHVPAKTMSVETLAGIMKPEILSTTEDGAIVKVDMGKPVFKPADIPVNWEGDKVIDMPLTACDKEFTVSTVFMGVPHTLVLVDDVDAVPLKEWGPAIEKHDRFPQNTNVNFTEILGDDHIVVRTWERGAGATLACGTGCCGSAVLCLEKGLVKGPVTVDVYLGQLTIDYDVDGTGHVFMSGPAVKVFETEL